MLKRLRVIAPIVGATGVSIALSVSAHADVDVYDPLSGSTNAIFLGGTADAAVDGLRGGRRKAVSGAIGVRRWRVDLRHGWKLAVRRFVAGVDDAGSVRVRPEQPSRRDEPRLRDRSRIQRG